VRLKLTALAGIDCSVVEELVDGMILPCYEDEYHNPEASVTCLGTIIGTLIMALKDSDLWPVPPEVSIVDITVKQYADWLHSDVAAHVYTVSKSHQTCPAATEYTERIAQELTERPDLPAAFIQHFMDFASKTVPVPSLAGTAKLIRDPWKD
jgi:hypothetical protein